MLPAICAHHKRCIWGYCVQERWEPAMLVRAQGCVPSKTSADARQLLGRFMPGSKDLPETTP